MLLGEFPVLILLEGSHDLMTFCFLVCFNSILYYQRKFLFYWIIKSQIFLVLFCCAFTFHGLLTLLFLDENWSSYSRRVKSSLWERSSFDHYYNSWNGGKLNPLLIHQIYGSDFLCFLETVTFAIPLFSSFTQKHCYWMSLQQILWPFLLKMIIPRTYTGAVAVVRVQYSCLVNLYREVQLILRCLTHFIHGYLQFWYLFLPEEIPSHLPAFFCCKSYEMSGCVHA